MTITAQTSKTGPYNGNGTTTVFSYTFEVQDEAHLVVTLADASGVETVQVLNTDYTVSGVGNPNGGQITMTTAPAATYTLTISRNVPITQEVDLENRRSVAPEVLEDAYDKLTQIAQDLSEQVGRAIKISVTEGGNPTLTLQGDVQANTFLGFDAAGNLAQLAPASGTFISPSAAIVAVDDFTGDGITVDFTLGGIPQSPNNLFIFLDGVMQDAANYTVSGTTLTFTTAPPLNTNIEVRRLQAVALTGGTTADLVTYSPAGSGAVNTTVETKLREFVSVKDFGAVGDGVTDDAAAIQIAFDYVDAAKIPSIHFPTVTEDYLVQSPVSLTEPGVLVFGDKGSSYNRGGGKKGNILVGSSSTHGLDLGNNSTATTNPADMWSVSNLGFLQAAGVTAKTKRGVAITRQNNGPDRGVIFSQISAIGMEAGIYIPPAIPGVQIQVANIVVENSCLSNNKYGLWSEGKVWGLRFVGNQAEQNNNGLAAGNLQGGAVHGNIQGGITINDNMLEGQPNAVNILAQEGAMVFESQRNYFETNNVNNSEYVYSLGTTSGVFLRNTAVIGPNHRSGTNFPADYARITGKGSWTIQMNDPFPITFYNWSGSLLKGSNIFPNGVDNYRLRQVDMTTASPEIYIHNGLARYDATSAWTHVVYGSGTQMDTPLGVQYVQDATVATSVPIALTAGDLVVINAMVLIKDKTATTFNGQILTHTGAFLSSLGPSYANEISGGEWCLISMPFIAGASIPSFQFKYFASGGTVSATIAGISAINYGAYVNDGTAVQAVSPVAPKFN